MTPRSRIFISAVTKELRSSRQLVANTLQFLGCEPVWQDIFGTEEGDLRGMLRKQIDDSNGVVLLVGQCYGAEPATPDELFGRVSYTQYEVRYAQRRGKKVWRFLLDPTFPTDQHDSEPNDLSGLQAKYRRNVQTSTDLFHPVASPEMLEAHILKMRKDFREAALAAKRLTLAIVTLLLVILGLVTWLVVSKEDLFTTGFLAPKTRLSSGSGSWTWDQFVSARVAQSSTGTLLGDEPYEVQLEMKNRTTMPLIVTRITVVSRNEEAALLLGRDDSQVFKAEIYVPHQLNAHEAITVPVKLNQILPKAITVQIFHNHSNVASEFKINLGGQRLTMPAPRYLSRAQVFAGYDSMQAIERGTAEAKRWSGDAQLVAAFPADNSVSIDEESRLKYTIVASWVTTFYSPSRGRMFMSIASANHVQGTEVKKDPDDIPPPKVLEPMLGYQQVVDLANRASLLSADWKSVRLGIVEVQGKPSWAWHLPYRAPSGLPILIDATTGEQLVPHPKAKLLRVRLEPVAPAP